MANQGRGMAPENLQHLRAYAGQERARGDERFQRVGAMGDGGNHLDLIASAPLLGFKDQPPAPVLVRSSAR
jgi:hypothetical protein